MSIGWLPSENCNLYFLNYQKFIPLMHSHIEANPEEHQSVLKNQIPHDTFLENTHFATFPGNHSLHHTTSTGNYEKSKPIRSLVSSSSDESSLESSWSSSKGRGNILFSCFGLEVGTPKYKITSFKEYFCCQLFECK